MAEFGRARAKAQAKQLTNRQAAWTLKALRINQGLSQTGLAVAAGVTKSVVSRAEDGDGIREEHQVALANVFGLEATDIWKLRPILREAMA